MPYNVGTAAANTVLVYAFCCWSDDCIQANARDSQYDATLLHWAVNEGHMPTVEHLLSCGADVRLRDGKQ